MTELDKLDNESLQLKDEWVFDTEIVFGDTDDEPVGQSIFLENAGDEFFLRDAEIPRYILKLQERCKRLEDALREIDASCTLAEQEHMRIREDYIYGVARAALSEQETCPVHDFKFPCVGCAQIYLDVSEQEK